MSHLTLRPYRRRGTRLAGVVTDALRVAVTVEQAWHRVPGGTATSVLRTAAAVSSRGDVQQLGVAALHRGQPSIGPLPLPVRHVPLPRQALYPAWQLWRFPPLRPTTGPVDLVHATSFAVPPAGRTPLVVTVHDLAFLHDPEHYSARGNRFFRLGLELTRRHARLVLVPSEQTRDECLEAGLDAARIRVVPWGVEPARAGDVEVARVRGRYGLDRPYLLWAGTHEPRKNLPTLLAAYDEVCTLADLDLVLVGPDGWGEQVPEPHPPPPGRVRTLGFVPQADLEALYAGAHVFCYPSSREGFGMPVLEAMAHGVPVVTSLGTPMQELVGNAGEAVPATDAAALAAALLRVGGPARDALGALARERASRRGWDATAEATVAAYREAVSG